MTDMAMLKTGWKPVKFGEVVRQVKNKVDPETSGLERYVAGEHMDTDDLRIRRWGEIGDGYLGPAFHMHFKPGQVLYGSRRTYLRKVAVADFEGICANTTFVLEPHNPEELHPQFLPFLMQTDAFNQYSVKNSKGSVNPYINFSDLARFEFALPPMEVQRAAIAKLQVATNCSNSLEEALTAGERLLQAYKDEEIGKFKSPRTKEYNLEQLLLESPGNGCSAPPKDNDTGYFVLGLASLSRQGYVSGDFKPVEPTQKMLAAKLASGDLLISRSNTLDRVGYVGIFNDARDDVSFPDTMMRLKPNPELVESRFLEMVLQTSSSRRYLMRIAAGTSASMKKINRANLLKMPVSLPTPEEQNTALEKLQDIKSAVAEQKTRLMEARQLTKIIATQVMGGERISV